MDPMDEAETARALQETPGWTRTGDAIERTFVLGDFAAAMRLVTAIAGVAEEMDHHPDILIRYDRVTLTLSTHSAGGLTGRDFELARRIDALPESPGPGEPAGVG